MNTPPSFVLRLFASPSLAASDGSPLTGRPIQRHRLALLALLARSPRGGLTREALMAYLWPESDSERARNLLNVSVYVLRRALGEQAIPSAGSELRLATELVDVDVLAFESALKRGDRETAVNAYRGPFLEGFFLKDAPEFERWVERERARLADQFAGALESLAEEAEARRDMASAVDQWKALAAHDPYDASVAMRLVQALADSGNRAGALRHARIHEQLVREELGLEPAPGLQALVARLRAEPAPGVRTDVSAELPPEADGPTTGIPTTPAANVPPPPRPKHLGSDDARPLHTGTPADASDMAVGRSPPRAHWRRAALLAASLLTAVMMILGLLSPAREHVATGPGVASIAVLPLANRSTDARDAALADGMTEELIGTLAGAGIRVISSTSAFALRDHRADVRDIAHGLGVSHILEGDWQTGPGTLRLRLRLVDGTDGSIRWSANYQRPLGDVFAVQEAIARAVALSLGVAPLERRGVHSARPPTTSVMAWELYRRASQPEVLRSDSATWQALDLLRRAVELDSTFAGAHAGLARLSLTAGSSQDPDMPRADRLAVARRHAVRATELDSRSAEAYGVLGITEMRLYDFDLAEAHLERALELDPSRSRTREWLVHVFIWEGRFDEALEQAERALVDDPLSASARAEVARALLVNGRCDEALTHLSTLADLVPPLLRAGPIAAQCHARRGMWAEALAAVPEGIGASGAQRKGVRAYFLAQAGRSADATDILTELLAATPEAGHAFSVAMAYTGLGRLDEAFHWLDRSIDDYSLDPIVREPMFADLHRDRRFPALMARLGL